MSLNTTPAADRVHIGFFGIMNAGKSSLVNALTGQEMSVVSAVPGTTTDPVRKTMELLPILYLAAILASLYGLTNLAGHPHAPWVFAGGVLAMAAFFLYEWKREI